MALDADTGKVIWEYKFNIFQSDVPPHRVGWASPPPIRKPETCTRSASAPRWSRSASDGKLLWQRSIGEEFAAFTTHGGRTMSPIIDGDLVIVSAAVSNWGTQAARAHRFIALNKRTGEIVYVANPGGRPYDTAYAAPMIATINGTRLLIAGLGDGGVHAIKAQTGEKVWSFVAAKRAINTGVVVSGNTVIVSHGDENLTGNQMGMIAAIDGSQAGDIKTTKWAHYGEQFGFSSPLIDGSRVYQIENGSRLKAYDLETGKELWTQPLGTSQKAPPVMADGKIFVGTENGKFFIVRPHADRAEILSDVELPISTNSIGGSEGTAEQVFGGAAISRGRVFFVSTDAVYAIGPKQRKTLTGWAVDEPASPVKARPPMCRWRRPSWCYARADRETHRERHSTAAGGFCGRKRRRGRSKASRERWLMAHLPSAADRIEQAGLIKATVGTLTGEARARVSRPMPWEETFESMAEKIGPAGLGQRRRSARPAGGRDARRPESAAEDTDQHAVQARTRLHRSRRMVELHDAGRRARTDAAPDDGRRRRHRAALQPGAVRNHAAAQARAVGTGDAAVGRRAVRMEARRVVLAEAARRESAQRRGACARKSVAAGEPEPAAWQIDKTDPIGNRQGAPGFFIDAEFGAYIDNLKMTPNE